MPPASGPDDATTARSLRPTRLQVDLDAIAANLRLLRSRMGGTREMLGIVKADAYGHGALAVSRLLCGEGIEMLGVALPEEGIELRQAGVTVPILVLGAFSGEQIRIAIRNGLTPAACSPAILDRILEQAARAAEAVPFHLKLDTGMGRLGLLPDQLPAALRRIKAAGGSVRMDGIFTHFSCADDPADPHTAAQLDLFSRLLDTARRSGLAPARIHAAGSGGILNHPMSLFTMARPGISLYGLQPSDRTPDPGLRPALRFVTQVVLLKSVRPGASLGYGHEGVTSRRSLIGTLDAGYADGLPRLAFPGGWALVRGRRAPYIGRISMDHAMVDLTDVPGAQEGDEAVLIGRQGGEEISAHTFASWSRTMAYEALCRFSPRVPRMHAAAESSESGIP